MAINRTGNNTAYGFNNPLQKLNPSLIFAERDPESTDLASLGTMWINTENNTYFFLTSSKTWTPQAVGSTTVGTLTITGGSGTVLTVEPSGNTSLGGELTVAGPTFLNDTLLVQGAAAFNGQIDINSNSLIDIQSSSNTYPAIRIQTDGGSAEGLFITNIQGEGSHATADAAIFVYAAAGGIDVVATKEVFIQSDAATAQAMFITTSAGSMRLDSAVNMTVNSTGNWSATSQSLMSLSSSGNMSLVSSSNDAQSIVIGANAGSQERVTFVSNLGEGTGSSSTAAVAILSAQGGSIIGAKKQIWIIAEHTSSQAIFISSSGSNSTDSIKIQSDLGGIDIDATTLIDMNATTNIAMTAGGTMTLSSTGAGSVSSDAGLSLQCLTSGVTITNTGDVSITADNNYEVTATGDIDLIATTDVTISSDTSVAITANNTGMISLQPKVVSTTSLTSTNDALIGKTILSNQTCLFNAALTCTISNVHITTTSAVLISAATYSPTSTGAVMTVRSVEVANGSVTFQLVNGPTGNLIVTDVINIAFQVL